MDAWIRRQTGKDYDIDGEYAKSGIVQEDLLKLLLSDPYFSKEPPKSTGREYFDIDWLETKLANF